MDSTSTEFLDALAGDLPTEERLILCGFGGDPYKAGPSSWKPRPWRPGRDVLLMPDWNGYVTVSSFGRAGDNSFRRRTETFASGLALMVDDVGTKVNPAAVAGLPPSARVETSEGNEQLWYFLAQPERDMARFDGVIRAFISGKLLGADPGMSGVTRVGRIPGFVNGKPSNNGWRVALRDLNDRRYTVDELLSGFGLQINGRRVIREKLHSEEAIERNRNFATVYKWMKDRRMLKKNEPDPSGWTEATCFNIDMHTAGADSGAAIREPSPENDFHGAWRCHHGHCIDLGWRELTDWIAEQSAEELESASSHDDNYQRELGFQNEGG